MLLCENCVSILDLMESAKQTVVTICSVSNAVFVSILDLMESAKQTCLRVICLL